MLKLTKEGLRKDMRRDPSRLGDRYFLMLESFWRTDGVEGMEDELNLVAPSSVKQFVRAARLFADSVERTSGTR